MEKRHRQMDLPGGRHTLQHCMNVNRYVHRNVFFRDVCGVSIKGYPIFILYFFIPPALLPQTRRKMRFGGLLTKIIKTCSSFV